MIFFLFLEKHICLHESGCTDEEKKMNLEKDTCPDFISDGSGRIVRTRFGDWEGEVL